MLVESVVLVVESFAALLQANKPAAIPVSKKIFLMIKFIGDDYSGQFCFYSALILHCS
jgi:hypothetical protein